MMPTFINNTVSENSISGTYTSLGGGIFVGFGVCQGHNNIVFGNSASNDPDYYGNVIFTYSCSSQLISGAGNITANPMFMNPSAMDFTLLEESPCIDAGDPASPLDPDSTIADMGALYYDQGGSIPQPQIELSVSELVFDSTFVGETDSLAFIITNAGDADLILYEVFCNLQDIFLIDWNLRDTLVVPGDSLEIQVVFSPDEALLYIDEIIIENNDETASIVLEGQGLAVFVEGNSSLIPLELKLFPPHPNPFNQRVALDFMLPAAANIKLSISDIHGREAASLVFGHLSAGEHSVVWDARDFASGIYFAVLKQGEHTAAQKLVYMK